MKTKRAFATNQNGKQRIEKLFTPQEKDLVVNEILARSEFFKNMLDVHANRNLDADCGYPADITLTQFKQMYKRNPFGKRVCRVWPTETWRMHPEVYQVENVVETEFERVWKKLETKCRIYHFLKLIDELSGIGHYGVLFLGVDDGQPLNTPIRTIDERGESVLDEEPVNLVYLRAFDEELAVIKEYETDETNPRAGLPTLYEISFDNMDMRERQGKNIPADRKIMVHWSRVVHIAPDCTTSLVWGTPKQEAVFNSLLDIRKILGGSAEMFWKGAFPGLSFETHPDAITNSDFDEESIKQQMLRYQSGLQRYFASLGLTVKSLAPQVEDPSHHLDVQIEAICTVLEMPKRVFLGSEIGQLASSQDKATWNDRVKAKQDDHTTPILLRPFITRLILIGALPFVEPDEVKIHWPDLNAPSGKDKADVAAKITDSLYKYVVGQCYRIIPPEEFLSIVCGFDIAQVTAIMDAAMQSAEGDNEEDPMIIKEEQDLERQEEQQRKQFQQQKELTQVKQRRATAVANKLADNSWHKKRRKKKKVRRKRKMATSHSY